MTLKELILQNRSYRRFDQQYIVSENELINLVELARLCPSARNMQPLRYILISTSETNEQVFDCLSWAGYLKDWSGPKEGERPSAYIVVTKDTSLAQHIFCDDGLAIQTILLGAVEQGLGGCIIGAVNRKRLSEILGLDDCFEILYVIALGRPVENVEIEPMKDGDVRYWRDENQNHHVPKRAIAEIVIKKL